jgi:tight adherence protein C
MFNAMNPATQSYLLVSAIGGMIAVSAGIIGWQFTRALAEVPTEDRTYRDRPPLAFRILWWPIQWISYYLGAWLSIPQRQSLLVKLRLAGLDYVLSPEQLIAQRILASAVLGLIFWWIAGSFKFSSPLWFWLVGSLLGYVLMRSWFRDRIASRRQNMLKALPFFLDLITLCVEAGLNLTGAFQQAVAKGPAGPLRDELARVLRDIRAGKARVDALRTFGDRLNEPAVISLVSAVIQGEEMGMNLGPILRAQSEQRRSERFARAEKAAMEAPVKMLFPLIFFIFPCTFAILLFPIVVKFMQMGM